MQALFRAGFATSAGSNDDFQKIINEAIQINEAYRAQDHLLIPPFHGSVCQASDRNRRGDTMHSADGQWEVLKSSAKKEGVRAHTSPPPAPPGFARAISPIGQGSFNAQPTPSSTSGGCASISAMPKGRSCSYLFVCAYDSLWQGLRLFSLELTC